MDRGPQYQRAETRYEVPAEPLPPPVADPRVTPDPRLAPTPQVTTSRWISPVAIVTGLAGVVLLALGLIAIARGDLDGSLRDPVVTVGGLDHTPLLGVIEAGVGLLLLLAAATASRPASIVLGTLLAVAGIVVIATPESFDDSLAVESSYGWLLLAIGTVVALTALLLPDTSRRVVTYR
jgi:hypothetical protein